MINRIESAGQRLARELQERGWSQQLFAEVIGRSAQVVSEIISGKKGITRETAAQLGAALDTPPELWLRLQDTYLLAQMAKDDDLQQELAEITRRAESIVTPRPYWPVYEVKQSETGNYVATVDRYPDLWAAAPSERGALRKLKAKVTAARRQGA